MSPVRCHGWVAEEAVDFPVEGIKRGASHRDGTAAFEKHLAKGGGWLSGG